MHSSLNRPPWLLFSSIYITQYAGAAFILAAGGAIMREQGVALEKLALLHLIAIPMLGKILYAPFIDRFRLALKGQYRSWLLIAQLLMAGLLLITGLLDFREQFGLIIGLLLLYTLATGVQDVAIDGLACKMIAEDKRQVASSIQYSGNLFGNILGGGVVLILYPYLQWQGALSLLAALTCITLIQLMFFREPDAIQQSDGGSVSFAELWRSVKAFVRQHKRWFLLLLVYPAGFSPCFAIINPALVDNGWELGDIGFVTRVVGSLAGVLSAVAAAPVIARFGRHNALALFTLGQAAVLLLLIPLATGDASQPVVYMAVVGFFLFNPALLASLSTIIMDYAAQTQAKATFFTLQLSLVVVMGFIYSAISMMLAQSLGYLTIVITGTGITFCMALIGWKWGKTEYSHQKSGC